MVNAKSQLKSPSIQLNSSLKTPPAPPTIPSISINNNNNNNNNSTNNSPCMTPTKQQLSRPTTNTSQNLISKPQSSSNLPLIVSPLTTFQSSNNNNSNSSTTRNAQFTTLINISKSSPLKDATDNNQILNEFPDVPVETMDSCNTSSTYAKIMQQNFKEGMQAVKQSIQYNVCDIIEDDLNQIKYEKGDQVRSDNDYLNCKNTDDENEEEELVILTKNDTDRLNNEQSGEEMQQFLENTNEW